MQEAKNMPLYIRLANGTATKQERDEYMKKYAGAMERRLNKTYFEFSDEEELEYLITEENAKVGDLNNTDGTKYNCPICKNKGYIAVNYQGRYAEKNCRCLNIRNTMNQVKWSGLGDIFKKCTFKTFSCRYQWQALMKDKALGFIKSPANCFYVGGSSGSGKSHICTAIAGYFLEQGKDVNYVQWLDLVDDLNNTRFRQIDRYDELMNRIKNSEVLYIDDFLKGDNAVKPSSSDIKLAYKIINARYVVSRATVNKRYITVISSEWVLSKINGFDKATGGRILELSQGYTVRLDGEDKNCRVTTYGG